MPNFNDPTGASHGQLFCSSATLSKPDEESRGRLSRKGLLNGKLQREKTCSTDMMNDETKERSFVESNPLIPPPEGVSSLTMKQICSDMASGMNLLRNLDVASTNGNCSNCSSDSRNAGSFSVEDDGSIASRVLSLSSNCKSGSIFGSGVRSSGSSYEKSPKIRGVKFEYCTEGLGSESSDVNVSSLCRGEEQMETVPQSGKLMLHGVEDDSNLSTLGDLGENEDCTPKTNWSCGADRIKTLKCSNNFPPPLSTLKRTRYPHLPNTPLVFLRPLRMDGRFVLQEVRVPCRDFLRASRKDGRLRLELVRHTDEDDLSASPHKAWEENDEKCSDCSQKEGEDEAEEDGISFPTSHRSNSKEIEGIVQGGCYPMSEKSNPEEKEEMLQEPVPFDKFTDLAGLKSVSLLNDDQNLLKASGDVPADKVERNMPKKQKQQDLLISCDIDSVKLNSMHSMSQELVEQKNILGPSLMTVEDNGAADFSSLAPGLGPMQLELMKNQLQQELLRVEEREEYHPEIPPTTNILSKAFGTIHLQSSNEKYKGQGDIANDLSARAGADDACTKFAEPHTMPALQSSNEKYKGQGDIANDLGARAGADDACTKFAEPHTMPALSHSPSMLSSSFPDLQLSFTRMQAAIVSNAEAFHSSCKKGLDGNDWKKGAVAPFVGLPLRC